MSYIIPGFGGTGRAGNIRWAREICPASVTGRGGECGGLGLFGPSPHPAIVSTAPASDKHRSKDEIL